MARLAGIVVPNCPHHVTQRGNRRELMPNHVHLIVAPSDEDGLARAIGETHRRYTNFINARARWSGHLFQRRYGSVVMDEDHLIAAVRYVSLNPVRARLVARAEDWPWSSVRASLRSRRWPGHRQTRTGARARVRAALLLLRVRAMTLFLRASLVGAIGTTIGECRFHCGAGAVARTPDRAPRART